VLLSPFENSGGYGRLEKIGVPIVECADYMETSALGRAEWMKFYGMLYGKEREADSLFHVVDSVYHSISEKAKRMKRQRSMITEKLTGNTWYVAGGRSTVGQLIADANGDYVWASDEHSGSLALSFETILEKAGQSDVWVFNWSNSALPTYASLAAEFHGYKEMKAFRERNVWYIDTQKVPYFEEVSFRPDRLLRDYVLLLHPEASESMADGQLVPRYFTPLGGQ
jgi:iron complex transport system substrate-binding protein